MVHVIKPAPKNRLWRTCLVAINLNKIVVILADLHSDQTASYLGREEM